MATMTNAELFIGLLVAIAVLAGFARLVGVPYPVVLVLGGLAIGFIPGVPHIRVDPNVILLVFLPPLLYSAAFLLSARELRVHARTIFLLAVGLVVVTMAIVASVAHAVAGLGWAPAFVLGAAVGATDPIAATSVLERLGAPRRISTILEGESLVNDGTALVAYKVAVGAVGAATFSLPDAIGEFVVASIGGAAVGLAVGWLSARIRQTFDESRIEITVSLLTPFAAYIAAVEAGLSGVLAAVAAGLYVGARSTWIFSAETRLRYYAFWEVLTFLLNSLLFLLIGLELHAVLKGLASVSASTLAADAALLSTVVLGVRLIWMFAVTPVIDALPGMRAAQSPRERLVLGWSAMRGGLTLAAALAIPLTAHGAAFPHRDRLVFLTYLVIVMTLVLPGLTLPALIRRLGVGREEERASARLAAEARADLARAALARLDDLERAQTASVDAVSQVRAQYDARLSRAETLLGGDHENRDDLEGYRLVRSELVGAERAALADLRRRGRIPDAVVRALERELDLEEARLRGQR
jgi:Na+/H+ antiporter